MATCVIRETYEIITPESAEEGDADERGWIDEEGTEHTFREAYEACKGAEASSSMFHTGLWYTHYGSQDMHTGGYENRSLHLEASERFQRRLYRALGHK